MVYPLQPPHPADPISLEIINEAESNDGIKQIICERDGSLVVKYVNGFWNQWLADYAGGHWSAPAIKAALLQSQLRVEPRSPAIAPTRRA